MSSSKAGQFAQAVQLLLGDDLDASRKADQWLRQVQDTPDAWGIGLQILGQPGGSSGNSTTADSVKRVASAMVAAKLKRNSPPITNVQAAKLLEQFIPICRVSGTTGEVCVGGFGWVSTLPSCGRVFLT